jgi:hypothetical protein
MASAHWKATELRHTSKLEPNEERPTLLTERQSIKQDNEPAIFANKIADQQFDREIFNR